METADAKVTSSTPIVCMQIQTGNICTEYRQRQSQINGGLQILIGILSIVFNIVDISYTPHDLVVDGFVFAVFVSPEFTASDKIKTYFG